MKKSKIFFALIPAMCLMSCDDKSSLGIPVVNEQPPVLDTESMQVALTAAAQAPISLDEYKDSPTGIPVLEVTDVVDCPEGYKPSIKAQISATETFESVIDLPVTMDENVATIKADDWEAAHLEMFGRNPKQTTAYMRFAGYLVKGSTEVRMGGNDYYYVTAPMIVTPYALGFVVEPSYYLVGTFNEWQLADGIKFKHSEKDVYDDPVFTLTITITPAQASQGWEWRIAPQSAVESGNANEMIGVAESDSLAGELVYDGATQQAGRIADAGDWMITINIEKGTYEIISAFPNLYTPGTGREGWTTPFKPSLSTTDFNTYEGFVYIFQGWKITTGPTWNDLAGNYGAAAENDKSGSVVNGSNENIPMPDEGAGLYLVNFNLGKLLVKTTFIENIGLVGNINGWNEKENIQLTPSADFLTWTGTVDLAPDSEFKFNMNKGWDINLGGTPDELKQGGDNIKPGLAAGSYTVTLELGSIPYTCSFAKN